MLSFKTKKPPTFQHLLRSLSENNSMVHILYHSLTSTGVQTGVNIVRLTQS